jgi:hypothetical protein
MNKRDYDKALHNETDLGGRSRVFNVCRRSRASGSSRPGARTPPVAISSNGEEPGRALHTEHGKSGKNGCA